MAHGSGRRDAGASRLALGLFSAVVVTALLVLLEVALLPALAIGALSGLGAFLLYQRAGRKPAGNSRRSNARRSHETGTGYVAGAHGAGWDGGADGGGGFDGGGGGDGGGC